MHQEIKVNIGDRVVRFEGADFHGEVTDFFFYMTSGEIKVNVD